MLKLQFGSYLVPIYLDVVEYYVGLDISMGSIRCVLHICYLIWIQCTYMHDVICISLGPDEVFMLDSCILWDSRARSAENKLLSLNKITWHQLCCSFLSIFPSPFLGSTVDLRFKNINSTPSMYSISKIYFIGHCYMLRFDLLSMLPEGHIYGSALLSLFV